MMDKPIYRGWIAILVFGAVAATTTGPLFDKMVPLIILSCVSLGAGIAFYTTRMLANLAYLAPTFGALGCLFLMLAFRTSAYSSLLLVITIIAYVASLVMAIAGRPKREPMGR
jgi:hypothetical protein